MDTSETFANEYADSTFFKGDICGPIAATMNEAMFLLVVLKWRNAFDGLKETNDYKFLSAAGSLMKNMVTFTSFLNLMFWHASFDYVKKLVQFKIITKVA